MKGAGDIHIISLAKTKESFLGNEQATKSKTQIVFLQCSPQISILTTGNGMFALTWPQGGCSHVPKGHVHWSQRDTQHVLFSLQTYLEFSCTGKHDIGQTRNLLQCPLRAES